MSVKQGVLRFYLLKKVSSGYKVYELLCFICLNIDINIQLKFNIELSLIKNSHQYYQTFKHNIITYSSLIKVLLLIEEF